MSDSLPADDPQADAPERNVFFLACQNDELFRSTYDLSTWQLLGEGASGCVVRIFSRVRREYVAVKILERVDEETHRKIADEVRVADKITSESVVRIHGPLMSPQLFWLEMEYVAGRSLRAELDRIQAGGGRLSLREGLELSRSIVKGVAAIHSAGVVHRDLKPHNIILPTAGQPRSKITDFGISRFWDQERATLTTEFRGTPQYTAPELLRSRKEGEKRAPLRPESDIYSLGMVLYEALTGRLPYNVSEDADAGQWSAAHLGAAPTPPRHHNQELPGPIADLLMAMLSKQPEQRPRLGEVVETLERFLAPMPASAPAKREASKRAAVVAAAIVSLAVLIAIGITSRGNWGSRGSDGQRPAASMPSVSPSGAANQAVPPITIVAASAQGDPPADIAAPSREFSVALDKDGIAVTNRSGASVTGISITLVDERGNKYANVSSHEKLVPGGTLLVPLAFFEPVVPSGIRLVETQLTVERRGSSPLALTFPLR